MIWEIIGGLIGGLVGGMGMGGGTLLIPILTLLAGFEQLEAQGINLISFIPMSIVALILHFKNKLVRFKETYWLAIIGAVVSILSALIAIHINNTVLKKLFALFLIAIGIWQLVELIKSFKQKKKEDKK
ncbi:MAG: sulfite exporter TauE/SafE family protein [Clostridia bacterium]|nr:sulfite exporter TauE/SafE family protein [Clostridia bacterium]